MAPPDCVQISEELLTRWSLSCVHINHLGTLLQRELQRNGEYARLIDLAERIARTAWDLSCDLRQHGARNSNALIETPRLIQVQDELPTRWAEDCVLMYNTATLVGRGLPRSRDFIRVIDLAERATRRAWAICSELMQHGARPAGLFLDKLMS